MKDKIKVYVAILNNGWVHTVVAFKLLTAMISTPGIHLIMEEPSQSWHHPISSNRNKITRRFLQTDCEYLLMIDDDVIPMHNPLEMVSAGKDILGFPAKVRQTGMVIDWTSYVKCPGNRGYTSVNLSAIDDEVDILQVDAVGTGCILIKREVLENLKAPFHCEYDEDGILTMGTDFAFCEKAERAGFEVYTAPHRYCEHIKKLGLFQTMSWADVEEDTVIPYNLGLQWGGMSISWPDWKFIRSIIQRNDIKKMLEFGCGLSSLLIQEHSNIISLETSEDWKKAIDALSASNYKGKNLLDIKMWDGKKAVEFPDKFDLIFIDGPGILGKHIDRECSFATAVKCSDRIIVHDAGRETEVLLQQKYLSKDFKVVGRSGFTEQSCVYWIKKGDSYE